MVLLHLSLWCFWGVGGVLQCRVRVCKPPVLYSVFFRVCVRMSMPVCVPVWPDFSELPFALSLSLYVHVCVYVRVCAHGLPTSCVS